MPSRTFCEFCAFEAHSVNYFTRVRQVRHVSPQLRDCVMPNPRPTPPPVMVLKKSGKGRPKRYTKAEALRRTA